MDEKLYLNLSRMELITMIEKMVPAQEWCNDPFWNKYGKYWFGIGDGFEWNSEELQKASNETLWMILGLCSSYWLQKYEVWHKTDKENLRKVFDFVKACRKYISFEDTSYESNFTILEKIFEFIKNRA